MKTGIIGFFDILGYKSFLQNNSGDAVGTVVTKLVELEKSLLAEMVHAFSHRQSPVTAAELASLIKWLVVSDTILLFSEFEVGEADKTRSNRWQAIHFASMLLWRRMFAFGLPLRGVIHTGEFLIDQGCFAGRAIVEAYELSQDLDLAGYAYSSTAFADLRKQSLVLGEADLLWLNMTGQSFEYLMPRKGAKQERLLAANPLALFLEDSDKLVKGDIRQCICEAFWKHNKDIPDVVQTKLNNTEQYLRAARFAMDPIECEKRVTLFRPGLSKL
jgi:hypothetical protein